MLPIRRSLLRFAPAFVVALLALAGCRTSEPDTPEAPVAAAGTYLNHGPDATYVGAETCRTCHAAQYATFVESEMGRSFRKATLANSNARFDGVAPVYDAANDLHYQPFRQGETLFVREFRLAGGDTVHNRVEQIDYIVGSGHHTNSHMREENGYVYQVPLTWYVEDGRWDLPPGFRGNPESRFRRPIPEACMTCHNAMPGFVAGSENKYDRVPLGIDCERCHGPGSIHVEQKQAGQFVDVSKEIDYTIVNPGKLAPERQIEVCERCHMQATAVFNDGKGPSDFRPGMRLADVMTVFELRDTDSTARFRMAAHPDRLRMSDCFKATYEEGRGMKPMTCLTCHDPHKPVEAIDYNATCRSCHGGSAAPPAPAASTETATCPLPEVVRSPQTADCAGCHMPTSGTWDIPHVTITDHYIRVPGRDVRSASSGVSRARVDSMRQVVRLAAVAPAGARPSDRVVAEGFMGYYEEVTNRPGMLDSAAARLERAEKTEPITTIGPSLVRLRFLQNDFAAVRELARRVDSGALDAWTLYRIGTSFTKSQEFGPALDYLQRATAKAPFNLRFRQVLASTYGEAGQFPTALATYDALLAEDPGYDDAYNNRGFVRLQTGDLGGAEADFQSALGLAPNHEMALANLASVFANTGRPAEARSYVERLVRVAPGNAQYRQFLDALRAAP